MRLHPLGYAISCGVVLILGSCEDAGDRAAAAGAPPPRGEALALEMEARLASLPGPAITLETLEGDLVDLGAIYGSEPVYLKMWATWCGPCREQMPHLESTYARLEDGFTVLAVATGVNETEEEVRAFVAERRLETPVAIDDGRLAEALNLRVTPAHVVIGRDGRIMHVGHLADERLEAALRDAARRPARASAEGRAPMAMQVSSRLPDRIVTTIDGEELRLGANGEPTALLFFLPWCESYYANSKPELSRRCREVEAEAVRRQLEGRARWIGVASGLWQVEADVARHRDSRGMTLPLVLDASGELFRSFGVRSTPVIIVFGPDGEAVARIDAASGYSDLRSALDVALGEGATQ